MKARRWLSRLILVLLIPLEIDLVLNVVDVWGVRYFNEVAAIGAAVQDDPTRPYHLPSGRYDFRHMWYGWTATINPDGTRRTPASRGWCKVAFVGDSMTFGHGVNDDATWVNLLAARFGDIHALNYGTDGYNSEHVLRTVSAVDAALYVYLIVPNDAEPTGIPLPTQQLSMIEGYARFAALQWVRPPQVAASPEEKPTRFWADLTALQKSGNVVLFAIDHPSLRDRLTEYDVFWVTDTSNKYRVSYADAHPNQAGHVLLANEIGAALSQILPRYCGSF